MGTTFSFALAIIFVPSAPALKDVSDQKAMQGTWEVTGFTFRGHKMPQEQLTQTTVTIRGNKIQFGTFPALSIVKPDSRIDIGLFSAATCYQFSLDSNVGPKSIDLSLTTPEHTFQHQGIYRLDRERLVICYSWRDRPKEFQSGETDIILEFRRSKR